MNVRRAASWLGIQISGYRPEHVASDVLLALVCGAESVLWACTFAAMVFSGPLTGFLPIAITVFLMSTGLLLVIVGISSHLSLHLAAIDEQAVAVVASIAILAGTQLDQFASPAAAAATIFVIMAAVSLMSGLALHLAARFNIGPLIQLVPFPVVCGFLGGLGWIFCDGAVTMLTDIVPSANAAALIEPDMLARWAPALLGGAAIFALIHFKDHFLLLPGSLLAGVAAFYLIAMWNGASLDSLRHDNWVFHFGAEGQNIGIGSLAFADINFAFIGSVLPQMLTIVGLSLLNVSFNLSALEVGTKKPLPLSGELRVIGTANIASGIVMCLPGASDVVATVTFRKVGATSRTFPLIDGALCFTAAIGGGIFIEYVPKVVVGAIVFFTAFHLMHDWLISARRNMTLPEACVVWSIFAVIVVVGFVPGIVLGVVLTSFLFIVRYSQIDIVHSSFFLNQLPSSVERPAADLEILSRYAKKVRVFNLRGFLFFGSTSSFYESLKLLRDQNESYEYIVINFRRVSGIDSTAVQIFFKIVGFLETTGTSVIFCGMNPSVRQSLTQSEHADQYRFLVRDDMDTAVRWVEEHLLVTYEIAPGPDNIHDIVAEIFGDRAKAEAFVDNLERLEVGQGDYLFRQGESDISLYVIEAGTIEVRLEVEGRVKRLRDFRKGSVIGEMAAYREQKIRSASAVALEQSVVYRLAPEKISSSGKIDLPILHEFVARLVVARLTLMNRRLTLEI